MRGHRSMRPRLPLSLVILLLVFCFGLGMASALLARGSEERAPASALPSPHEEQVNILVIGVDDLANSGTALTALWLASFEPPGRELFVTGISIHAPAPSLDGAPLSGAFAWASDSGPSTAFLAALHSLAPLEPDAVITLDRVGFAAVVDYLGGVELNGALLDGAQVTAVLELLEEDANASVAGQRGVLQSMVARAEALGDAPDISPLTRLIPDHAWISVPLSELVAQTAPLLPLDAASVHFDLYPSAETPAAD
jgi:hypothetical protein